MSRKGNCLDNSPMENFFGLLKQEMYHGEVLCTYNELKRKIERYIGYYNNKRIKQKIGWYESGSIPNLYQPISCLK